MTFTNSTIKIFLQLRALLAVIFNLQQVFPLSTPRDGHGIGEAKRDELNEAGKVAMRQIAPFMPAEKTESFSLICERMTPMILFQNQIAKVFAFGLRFHFRNADLQIGMLLLF